jgi:hypothetical protein
MKSSLRSRRKQSTLSSKIDRCESQNLTLQVLSSQGIFFPEHLVNRFGPKVWSTSFNQ